MRHRNQSSLDISARTGAAQAFSFAGYLIESFSVIGMVLFARLESLHWKRLAGNRFYRGNSG